MPESVFNVPSKDDEATQKLREMLKELSEVVPEDKMQELKQCLTNAFEEEFNSGYRVGAKDGEERAYTPDSEHIKRGEAKGLAWALNAAKGMPVSPMTNPYANPNVVNGLLALGTKA